MQKALIAASRTSLLSYFGGRTGNSAAAVSVQLQSPGSRVRMATKAGEQVEKAAGDDPKVEVDENDEDNIAGSSHPQTRKAYRFRTTHTLTCRIILPSGFKTLSLRSISSFISRALQVYIVCCVLDLSQYHGTRKYFDFCFVIIKHCLVLHICSKVHSRQLIHD